MGKMKQFSIFVLTDILTSVAAITKTISFGDGLVSDPRSGFSATYPWTISLDEDVAGKKITMEIVGIPESPVVVGEKYDAYIMFRRESLDACVVSELSSVPMVDIIHLSWDIFNGPSAMVQQEDLHGFDTEGDFFHIADLPAAAIDERNDWSIVSWEQACTKVNTLGCDLLRIKIQKTFDRLYESPDLDPMGPCPECYTLGDYFEDVNFNGRTYEVSILTEHNSVVNELPSADIFYTFERYFWDTPCSAVSILSSSTVLALSIVSLLY